MSDLSKPGLNQLVANRIQEDVDEFCVTRYNGGHRTHLGASLIGAECKRQLWYVFRWVRAETFTGQQLRLFNRGHKEEDRFIEWLEGIGIEMWADDLKNNKLFINTHSKDEVLNEEYTMFSLAEAKAKENCDYFYDVSYSKEHIKRAKADGVKFPQYRISDVHGHFGGSLDGVLKLPSNYQIDEPLLAEFKTSNTKGFNALKKEGVVRSKPQHFCQTSTYGFKYNLRYALYMCSCKETDEIHTEVVKLDHNLGQQMIHKAEQIITSRTAPPKLSLDPTYYKCGPKWCSFREICHKSACCEVNCRSCEFASPAEGAKWYCSVKEEHLLKENMLKACPSYQSITDKV